MEFTYMRQRQRSDENRDINPNILKWFEIAPHLAHCKLRAYMLEDEQNPQVYPPQGLVFDSLESIAPEDVRVIVLSSDPSTRPDLYGPGVLHLSRRMTEAQQGTPGSHSHIGWEDVIGKLINHLNATHQNTVAWVGEPLWLIRQLGEQVNIFSTSELDEVDEYLRKIGREEIAWAGGK
jgi:hypothetical protein